VKQDPREGGLSAHDDVLLWVSRARYGQMPNFVGSALADVGAELKRLKLDFRLVTGSGPTGVVVRQIPRPGVAVAPGMKISLVVGDGSRKVNR
jgi:beta-lactam-binding protein with PASTA domain